MRKPIIPWIVLLASVGLCLYSFHYFGLYDYFTDKEKSIHFFQSFGVLSVIVFILFQILQVLAAPLPGEISGLIGGYLYGPAMGTLYSTIGLTIGSWIAFALARYFGAPLVG